MQILYVHPNLPAQFGPVLSRLARRSDLECVFVAKNTVQSVPGVRVVPFEPKGGATRRTHYCSRTFENAVWNAHAVYEACREAPGLAPDLVVGHSGFGTTAFLPDLFDCPVVNLFEYYYHGHGSDMDFRPEFPPRSIDYLRSRMRNAMILTDLTQCAVGYAPTAWQRDLFPPEWRSKLEVVHDGVDTDFWRRRAVPRRLGDEPLPEGVRVVTYVARGLEAMRGFDVFVRMAKRVMAARRDVLFVVVGEASTHYGNERRFLAAKSFRDHVLDMEQPDPRRLRFLGKVPAERLVEVLCLSDAHVYLTVPFVVSWSLLNAMACEAPVVASDTEPVREFVEHGVTGLLAPFHDDEALAEQVLRVLDDPERGRAMAGRARRRVQERCGLDAVLPAITALYARAMGRTEL